MAEGTESFAISPSKSFSSRYSLPSHLVDNIGDTSWETVVSMGRGLSGLAAHRIPEVRRLGREIALKRMLLMERALDHSESGGFDPKLLVDLVRLLERCENMAEEYDLDLREFNSFLALVIEKVKKEKMNRHEPVRKSSISRFAPMDEDEMERMKKQSEYRGGKKGRK